jgi:Zn-dependent protease with chaperone function
MSTIPSITSSTPQYASLPDLKSDGAPVNPKNYIEPKTGSAVFLGYFATFFGILIGGVFSYGILWVVLLFTPLIDYFNRRRAMAQLRGSGIEVGPQQLPELHACASDFAQRLGMTALPAIYIVEGNVINAAAVKIGGRKVVLLIDDVVDACLRSGDPQTLAFILGHEMAHHALGHTNLVRATLAKFFKKLARLDEFSCDAVANQLVGNSQVSAKALVTLLSGPQLFRYINLNQLAIQANEVVSDKHSVKAERSLTHPLLLRRIQRFH